jgi:SAM-dependent methyltransferase
MSQCETSVPKTSVSGFSGITNSRASGTLCRMFIEHEGYTSDKWEHYLPIYEAAFSRFTARGQPIHLLEIGVQNGGSLQLWSKYLPEGSTIVGIDIDPACIRLPMEANISIRIGDATDPVALDHMLGDAKFDVIIDDGSHHSHHLIATFEDCFKRLGPGGVYIIEDLHCSYFDSHGGGFRHPGTAIEWLKELVDALNVDHFESDAAAALDSTGLQSMQELGSQIAQITFFDSVAIVEKLPSKKEHPYRRIMTGRETRIVDLARDILLMPTAQLQTLLLSASAAASFAPTLLNAVVSAREDVGELRVALTQAEARLERAQQLAAEREIRLAEEARRRAETEQRAEQAERRLAEAARQRAEIEQRAEQAERRLAEAARRRAETEQRAEQAERHLAEAARRRAETEQRAEQAERHLAEEIGQRADTERRVSQLEAERDHFRLEHDNVLNSTFWRLTGPFRRLASILPPGLRRYGRRGVRVGYWLLTPQRTGKRIAYFRSQRRKALVLPVPAVELENAAVQISAHAEQLEPQLEAQADQLEPQLEAHADQLEPQLEKVPTYDELFKKRFGALEPLRTYEAPHHGPRVTIVTDSINSGSLYGGVATAIILGTLLARRLDAGLRLVTRTEPPIAENIGMILRTYGVPWTGNVDCLHSPPGSGGRDVPMSREDLFLTTSWWTTHAARRAVPPARIVYMLGEDERMFYPTGDEHLLCAESLTDPEIFYVVNSEILFSHLQSEGMAPGGIAFEPAFPSVAYYSEAQTEERGRRRFFFYARPNNFRNLYWRGIAAIASALEEGVLDPENWDFYFLGKDAPELVLPRGVRPRIINDVPQEEYARIVRSVDVGLSLIYSPHPSYPPFDLAASGAVVVTNQFGAAKKDLSRYSPNILCVEPSVSGLVAGLRRAVALAEDQATRAANAAKFGMPRDWPTALAPILDYMAARHSRG